MKGYPDLKMAEGNFLPTDHQTKPSSEANVIYPKHLFERM